MSEKKDACLEVTIILRKPGGSVKVHKDLQYFGPVADMAAASHELSDITKRMEAKFSAKEIKDDEGEAEAQKYVELLEKKKTSEEFIN